MVNMKEEVFALPLRENFSEGESSYDRVMNKVLNVAKVNQGQIEAIMNTIAYHESAGTMDPSKKQDKGGPARGLFQYELSSKLGSHSKGSGAGRTAMNRLYDVLGGKLPTSTRKGTNLNNMPKWMEPYFEKDKNGKFVASGDVNFSDLTATQQRTLFLADKLKTKGAIPAIGMIRESDWWAKFHHKGTESNKAGFVSDSNQFNRSGSIIPK